MSAKLQRASLSYIGNVSSNVLLMRSTTTAALFHDEGSGVQSKVCGSVVKSAFSKDMFVEELLLMTGLESAE